MKCQYSECQNEQKAKGFCQKHYVRFRLYGSVEPKSFDHEPIEIRFWKCVDKKGDDDCWFWQRPASSNGYGRIRVRETGKEESAHRVSWWMHNERQEIPKGMVVMHSCDNKLCVNPAHLSLGSAKDNTQDMIRKGRAKYVSFTGSKNGNALLDDAKVIFIKTSDLKHTEVAKLLGVSASCVADVRKGRSWTHVNAG
jgi:hypothetical protein